MNIVTGYRGTPHITAQQDRDINLGLIGNSLTDAYVLDVGQKLEADIVSANEVRIRDGVVVLQGCAGVIDSGAYDSLTISNGTQGMLRTDIIAIEYDKDADTNVESLTLVVVEGTPDDSDPQPPSLTSGSIQNGDNLVQVPLYYVNIDGVAIDSVEAQFTVISSLAYSSDLFTTPIETFTGTVASGLSGELHGTYDRFTKTVRINFYASKSSNIGTSDTLITIPSSYRPSDTKYGSAMIETYVSSANKTSAYRVTLNSSGQIKQGLSSYARSVFGVIEYTL